MSSTSKERQRRARLRTEWPVRRYRLGAEPSENLASVTTASERLAMMWELARQAYALSGKEQPGYERHQAPGRVIRAV